MTNKMKQVQLTQYGAPDMLTIVETTIPQPKAGEVLIKAIAIGVNFSDTLRRRNQYFQPTPLPYVLGSEVVGQVVSLGNGVGEPFTEGTYVLAILPFGGGYAEYVAAIAQYCVPLPANLDAKQATAIFVQGSTAQLMISQLSGNLQGKTVLINAAAGGVGSLLVQLAKLQGAKVVAACGSHEKCRTAVFNGADEWVNYTTTNWSEAVKLKNNGKGVDLIFEMAGGDVYNESIKCLADGGQLIVYGCVSGIQGHVHPEYFVDHNITQAGFNLAYYITTKTQVWQEALGNVMALINGGKLKIETPATFTLDNAAEAHRQIEARQTTGKVVLTVTA